MKSDHIYLDYAAATPVSDEVLAAMRPYWQHDFYNPSATYLPARGVKQALDAARQTVAEIIGARAAEIIFTAGGSEANNLAIAGIMRLRPDANMVTTAIEHDSVLAAAGQFDCRLAVVDDKGIVDIDKLCGLIDDKTLLVSVMYANNEIGSVQPIRDIGRRLAEMRAERKRHGNDQPLYLHTDAAQAANYLDLHVARLGVDLMTLNGGKIYGPKQSGCLYVRAGTDLAPLIYGGGQERGLRSGTENVAAAVGFAEALRRTQDHRHDETARLLELQRQFLRRLKADVPAAVLNGSHSRRLPNNIHITLPGTDNERLLLQLEQAGILAAAGSACSASDEAASHVLLAMGLSEAEARASVRFTMGRQTDEAAVDRTVDALADLLRP